MTSQSFRAVVAALALLLPGTAPALAQSLQEDAEPQLGLALNTVSATEVGGCRLTFVIRNGLGADIESLVAEAVLFDGAGQVATLTLFDFGALPAGRPRARQFDLAGQSCDGLDEVLFNGIGTCEGEGLAPETCLEGLRLSTRTDIEVTG